MSHSHICNCDGAGVSQSIEEMEFDRGLWNAAVYGRVEKLLSLLKKGIDPNSQDKYGYTALVGRAI